MPVFLMAALSLTACSKSPSPSAAAANPTSPVTVGDPVEKKLQELAGSSAINCGRLKSQAPDQMDTAAKCAMQSAGKKQPFYVAYELPGMIIAVAGNAEGKLFTLQGSGTQAVSASGACPSDLRVAPSGRVTCFAPGTFGMGTDATHGGGMTMPPASGENPHKGLGIPPPGRVNPHQSQAPVAPAKKP